MRVATALSALGLVALVATGTAADEDCGVHVVAPGDSLGRIARDHAGGIDAAALFELNRDRLDSADLIHPGQRLRLPCPPEAATPDAAAPAAPTDTAVAPTETARASAAPAPPALQADAAVRLRLTAPAESLADDPAAAAGLARLRTALPGLRVVPDDEAADLLWPVAAPDCALLHRLDPAEARLCIAYDLSVPLAQTPGPDGDVPLHAAAARDAPLGRAALAALAGD